MIFYSLLRQYYDNEYLEKSRNRIFKFIACKDGCDHIFTKCIKQAIKSNAQSQNITISKDADKINFERKHFNSQTCTIYKKYQQLACVCSTPVPTSQKQHHGHG